MQEKLAEICEALDNLVQNHDARIYASSQHALDESLVFGTTDAYLRLASELIRFVVAAQRDEAEVREIDGIKIQTSGSINSVFSSCSDIIFDNSDLVATETEARKLFEYWWDLQQGSISTLHFANYNGEHFQNCDFTDVQLKNCKIAGMKVNGTPLQDLLDKDKE